MIYFSLFLLVFCAYIFFLRKVNVLSEEDKKAIEDEKFLDELGFTQDDFDFVLLFATSQTVTINGIRCYMPPMSDEIVFSTEFGWRNIDREFVQEYTKNIRPKNGQYREN